MDLLFLGEMSGNGIIPLVALISGTHHQSKTPQRQDVLRATG
ncbi:hypothetical protein [Nostoc sp. NMS7]|nr:hypothetical protein [Nostoc sp. NMS7]